jgi:predicted DNA-binding antitoxin AbrB/MazE fold protein
MSITVEAVYEGGILRPATPLPLREKQAVRITIDAPSDWVQETAGMLAWTGDPEALRRLALSPDLDLEEP